MEISRRVADVSSGVSFEQMFLSIMTSNNAEIDRLTHAVREQTLYCCANRDDQLARQLLYRFTSALELAVLAGYRTKQIQECWARAIMRVP